MGARYIREADYRKASDREAAARLGCGISVLEERRYLYVPLVKGIGGIEIEEDVGRP